MPPQRANCRFMHILIRFYFKIKYFFDFFFALIALVICSPLFAAVAIAIKSEDGGHVFLRQSRTENTEKNSPAINSAR